MKIQQTINKETLNCWCSNESKNEKRRYMWKKTLVAIVGQGLKLLRFMVSTLNSRIQKSQTQSKLIKMQNWTSKSEPHKYKKLRTVDSENREVWGNSNYVMNKSLETSLWAHTHAKAYFGFKDNLLGCPCLNGEFIISVTVN